jgi:phospholipid-binding lipoprotein MlaA
MMAYVKNTGGYGLPWVYLLGCLGLSSCTRPAYEEACLHPEQKKSVYHESPEELEKQGIWDPLEGWNRGVFAFNQAIDGAIWYPLIQVYDTALPPIVKQGARNLMGHVNTVFSVVNSALQGEGEKTALHLARFFANTIFGLGGLVDVASDFGLKVDHEDFGKTLRHYGVPPGPFLIVPFFGPVVLRDSVGRLALCSTFFFFPLGLAPYAYNGLESVHLRLDAEGGLDYLASNDKDMYGAVRRAYYKIRKDWQKDEDSDTSDDDMAQYVDELDAEEKDQEQAREREKETKEKKEKYEAMEKKSDYETFFSDEFMVPSSSGIDADLEQDDGQMPDPILPAEPDSASRVDSKK